MLSMESIGFVFAGLTIIGLLRVLFAFRELRAELHDQRLALISAGRSLEALQRQVTGSVTHEQRLRDLEARAEVSQRAAQHASYEDATRLVQQGAVSAQLSKSCGLSRGEAQLVRALWSKNAGQSQEALTGVS